MSHDLITMGETMLRLSPEPGTRLETATSLDFRTAGAESNVAITASRLGTDSAWISKLPDSPLGRRVTTDLQKHGVTPLVTWDTDGRQGTYYLEPGGEPRGTNVVYDRADASVTTATPDELPMEVVSNAETFYVSGITPALSTTLTDTTGQLLERATESGTTTVFDLNYRSKLWPPAEARDSCEQLFDAIDVLFVAERDARNVLDMDGTPVEIGQNLAAEFSFQTVVVTRGSEGATAIHDDAVYEQSTFETETLDPIGTGDAFVGAFLARRIDGASIEDALAYGAATAALKRTISGDIAIVTPEEVERVLADSGGSISR